MTDRIRPIQFALALLTVVLSAPSSADGVREINQLCVPNGCFAGDLPGFPVEITESGSYRLTSDLDLRNEPNAEDLGGITILNVDTVLLDLGGHAVIGPNVCSGTPVVSCTLTNPSADAVLVSNTVSATIQGGHTRGMSRNGINCFNSGCTLRDLSASENFFNGIAIITDAQATIERVQMTRNRLNGIEAAFFQEGQSSIRDARATGNGASGFWTNGAIRNSQARNNGTIGIRCDGCNAQDNISVGNQTGFQFGAGSGDSLAGGNRSLNNSVNDWFGSPFTSTINLCTAGPC